MLLVHDFLIDSAARWPDKTALICDGQRLTYAQINLAANRLAHALRAAGVGRGDRVAIYLTNSAEAVIGIFAVLKAGGVFVVINHTTRLDKVTYMLDNCRATALLVDAGKAAMSDALAAQVESLVLRVFCGKKAAQAAADRTGCLSFDAVQSGDYSGAEPPRVNIDRDLACLIYTSGSTGFPKGVMSDHSNVVFAASSIIEYLQNRPNDIVINVLPLSFDYGLYQLLMVFKFGGTLVLERGFTYPAAVLQKIVEERATGFPVVPTILAMLLQMDLTPYDLSCLRYLTNTGAALPPTHIMEFRQRYPHVSVYSMYGLTETKRTLYLPPDQLDTRPDSVGIAIPGTEVWIEDENGQRLGPGQIGELVIRGGHVMRGYWADPQATAERYRPGPLPGETVCYSGDLFRMDAEGYLYFVGRKDDIIKCRGEKVAPKEIENVLYRLEGVVEAAVMGVPDPVMGQAIKAFVVVRDKSLTEAAILHHCRTHLEDLMMPRYVELRDSLPKTTSGKIKKQDLS